VAVAAGQVLGGEPNPDIDRLAPQVIAGAPQGSVLTLQDRNDIAKEEGLEFVPEPTDGQHREGSLHMTILQGDYDGWNIERRKSRIEDWIIPPIGLARVHL
jgi:hypothetical protein